LTNSIAVNVEFYDFKAINSITLFAFTAVKYQLYGHKMDKAIKSIKRAEFSTLS
jgi:hypothetical protein